jgi:hypothetical protein
VSQCTPSKVIIIKKEEKTENDKNKQKKSEKNKLAWGVFLSSYLPF